MIFFKNKKIAANVQKKQTKKPSGKITSLAPWKQITMKWGVAQDSALCPPHKKKKERSYREWQRQTAECKLLNMRLGDKAASVQLVAGIILQVREAH